MRAAATVVRLMPSPRNRIRFFAFALPAPCACALAAPARNHQAAVSPAGRWIDGTSICACAGAVLLPVGAGDVVAQPANNTPIANPHPAARIPTSVDEGAIMAQA